MIRVFLRIITASPFYPHWLVDFKTRQGNNHILQDIRGDVLEVGAGDGQRKAELLKKNKDIVKYIVSDYSSWDDIFERHTALSKKSGGLSDIIFGFKQRIKLDTVCSAMDLPFDNESFDYHLGFEVLEHINEPEKYFSEAARVLRRGGKIVLSVPFFYRIHGREPEHKEDYYRYANGFFYYVAKKYSLEVVEIFNNTGFGTSMGSMTNQWVIRRIMEQNIFIRFICLLVSPVVFFLANILGFLIDIKPDKRFTARFHVILQKK